jgi:D-serine deaminase-like pyridoxal phosphate-dependent protein
MKIADLDTPVVLIDLDVMERNLGRMSNYCASHGLKLRPHTKTHKIPALARAQVRYGASGVTVAKLGEAEAMGNAGIDDILIVYPLVGASKLNRLVQLAERITCTVALDSFEVAQAISLSANKAGVTIGVRVEFDTGFARCGLPITDTSMDAVKRIRDLPALRWDGLLTYPGHIMGTANSRELLIRKENEKLERLLNLFSEEGIECPVVSGGNTPAAFQSHKFTGLTEIRPGTYIFNDRNTVCAESVTYDDCAATVLTTVVSRSVTGKAILDAGSKMLSGDLLLSGHKQGYGSIRRYPTAVIEDLSEEHAHVNLQSVENPPKLGDILRVIPNHICPCINLQDHIYGCRGDEVATEWEVTGRGKVQ